jgi:hypothetical protein
LDLHALACSCFSSEDTLALPLGQRLLRVDWLQQCEGGGQRIKREALITMLGPTLSLCMLTNSRMILSFSASCKLLKKSVSE